MKIDNIELKRIPLYLHVKFKRYLSKGSRVIVDLNENKAKVLCFKIINHPNTALLTCNDFSERYVVNTVLNCNMIIRDNYIEFFDDYLHHVRFCDWNFNKIDKIFNEKLKEHRLILKEEFNLKIKHSFNDMYLNILKLN